MNVTYQSVKLHRIWQSLPNILSVEDLPLPKSGIFPEVYVSEYTEQQLRQKVIQSQHHFGLGTLNLAVFNALPADYVTSLYENTRYRSQIQSGIFQVRAENTFSSKPHAVPNLIILSRLLSVMYREHAVRVEPDVLYKANAILRILKQVDYALWVALRSNPTVNPGSNLVFSGQIVTTTAGQGSGITEDTYVVYFDADLLADYVDGGGDPQEAAQWWVDNKTQPPQPD